MYEVSGAEPRSRVPIRIRPSALFRISCFEFRRGSKAGNTRDTLARSASEEASGSLACAFMCCAVHFLAPYGAVTKQPRATPLGTMSDIDATFSEK
jgi:hypothetical protein